MTIDLDYIQASTKSSASVSREKIKNLQRESREFRLSDSARSYRAGREGLRMAKALGDPRLMIESLLDVRWHLLNRGDFVAARRSVDRARELAHELPGDRELHIGIDYQSGCVYLYQGDFPKAIELLTRALEAYPDASDLRIAEMMGPLAMAYRSIGQRARALEIFMKIEALWEAHDMKMHMAMTLTNIAAIYKDIGQPEAALDVFHRCLDISREMGAPTGEGSVLGNLGITYYQMGRYDEALEYLGAALLIDREYNQKQNEGITLETMAQVYTKKNELGPAMEYARRSLEIREQIDEKSGVTSSMATLGQIQAKAGLHEEALDTLRRALLLAREIGSTDVQCGVHEDMAIVYEQLGEMHCALEHYREYIRLEKELQGMEVQRAVADVRMSAEIDAAEKERELLRVKAKQLEQEVAYKERELATAALHLAQKSQLLARLQEQMAPFARPSGRDASELVAVLMPQLRENGNVEGQWDTFERQFRQAHPDFVQALLDRYHKLTPMELKICALMRINLGTKEIADILCTSVRTVEGHRRFIRRKLDLPRTENLYTFLTSLR